MNQMLRYALILLFFPSVFSVNAQDNTFAFRVGMGTYTMKIQKDYQDFHLENNTILSQKTVSYFPSFPSFGSNIDFKITNKSVVGLHLDYMSTGGRVHYKDYSGEAVMDQLLHAYKAGPQFRTKINRSENWKLLAFFEISAVYTGLSIIEEISVGSYTESIEWEFKSWNMAAFPGLMLNRNIKNISCYTGIGFEVERHGNLEQITEHRNYTFLYTLYHKKFNAQWDGVRAFLGIGILLNQASK